MGVTGLQTYLRENQRRLSTQHQLPSSSPSHPFVVDGWSFIYNIQFTCGIPWVYGGEYPQFHAAVISVVRAWLHLGCHVHFVFDGPYPALKFSTSISRLQQSIIKPALVFFRTSTSSRSQPRFLNENHILPPLSFTACISALRVLRSEFPLSLYIHLADEEGDPYAVELAGQIGGYVLGADSDFMILNTPGYKGYIPIDEMSWSATTDDCGHQETLEDGFQPVKKAKAKRKPAQKDTSRGLIPPDASPNELALSFSVYTPEQLASHINLPQSLLPLLGALLGNDYTAHNVSARLIPQKLFYPSRSTPSNRIARTSETIRELLATQKPKSSKQINTVIDLIEQTVHVLVSRTSTTLSSGELEQLVDMIVEGTLKYAIGAPAVLHEGLLPSEVCPLHPPESCKFLPLVSRKVEEEIASSPLSDDGLTNKETIRAHYLTSYRSTELSPRLADVLHTGTFWPRLSLESPDMETVNVTLGRYLRKWCYAILEDAVGLPVITEEKEPGVENDIDSDDELVDVVSDVESVSDASSSYQDEPPIKSLAGALIHLDTTERASKTHFVTEYVRRGSHVAAERVQVPMLADLLSDVVRPEELDTPIVLASPELRLSVLLRILDSDNESVRSVSPQMLLPTLAIRWIVSTLGRRAVDLGSRERHKERWTLREAQCFLCCFINPEFSNPRESTESPELTNRNLQLVAQFMASVENIQCLIQTLLLQNTISSPMHLFSGLRCHTYLTSPHSFPSGKDVQELGGVVREGLAEHLGEEIQKRKKSKTPANKVGDRLKKPLGPAAFALLEGMEA